MCGIAGFFSEFMPHDAVKLLQGMLTQIAHRGPDGSGTCIVEQAALGHVRLAVIDPAGGQQPMATVDGRFHISYNGEIYNFRELRASLLAEGYVFRGNSDTEVLLAAFQRYGLKAFSKCRGMFALALWDLERHEGFLVRDRFGIKPLFYTTDRNRLLFASEIKALLPVLSSGPGMDMESLHLLMNFRYIPGSSTLFKGIAHLPPGCFLRWSSSNYEMGRWADALPKSDHDAVRTEDVRESLQRAVRRQLVSDVPLGGYLSAGLDSATLLALSREAQGQTVDYPTFTIQTGDSPFEAAGAAATAEYFGVSNVQEPLEFDPQRILPRLIWHLEVPKVNALQSAIVARLARRHVTVALSGLGGDEIFLGYNIHRLLSQLDNLNRPLLRPLAMLAGRGAACLMSLGGLRYEEWQRAGHIFQQLPDFCGTYAILRNVWDTSENRQRIYGPRLNAVELPNATTFLRQMWPTNEPDPVLAAACFERQQKMVNDLLLQEDRLSMAFGLEVRVPFLDEDLVALLAGQRREVLMPGGSLKHLMREVVGAWLPPEIMNRPKSGFQVPIHLFFNAHLRPLCDKFLSPKRLLADGLFNPSFVDAVLKARPHPRLRWHYFMLYLMLGVNLWQDIFLHNKETPPWS